MMEPFIGEIAMFAGNYAPSGWALCNGQLLPISQNPALFALIGNTYGGDGKTNFALPDLRGRAPIHAGQGPGLSNYVLGKPVGSETVTLTTTQIPAHSHGVTATRNPSATTDPTNAYLSTPYDPVVLTETKIYATLTTPGGTVSMNPQTIQPAGGSQPHSNIQPSLAINYIIALQGIYPSKD